MLYHQHIRYVTQVASKAVKLCALVQEPAQVIGMRVQRVE